MSNWLRTFLGGEGEGCAQRPHATPFFSALVERALRVAAAAHAGQPRKGSGVPYVSHVAGVALILERAGWSDEHVLAAAILHDVVEDTGVTLDSLSAEFPAAVVRLVAALSETKTDTTGGKRPWEQRKRDHIEQLRNAPVEACAIALADKLHNLETMLLDLEAGTIRFEDFNATPDQLLWYYEEITDAVASSARVEPLADACDAALERLRRVIGASPAT